MLVTGVVELFAGGGFGELSGDDHGYFFVRAAGALGGFAVEFGHQLFELGEIGVAQVGLGRHVCQRTALSLHVLVEDSENRFRGTFGANLAFGGALHTIGETGALLFRWPGVSGIDGGRGRE